MEASLSFGKGSELSERQRTSPAVVPIKSVGIIGAGQMGNGIAHVAAIAGYDVSINDLRKEAIEKARTTIERNMTRQVSRSLITDAEMQAALRRIRFAPDLDSLGEMDLVIEAATEDETVKRKIFTD